MDEGDLIDFASPAGLAEGGYGGEGGPLAYWPPPGASPLLSPGFGGAREGSRVTMGPGQCLGRMSEASEGRAGRTRTAVARSSVRPPPGPAPRPPRAPIHRGNTVDYSDPKASIPRIQ